MGASRAVFVVHRMSFNAVDTRREFFSLEKKKEKEQTREGDAAMEKAAAEKSVAEKVVAE